MSGYLEPAIEKLSRNGSYGQKADAMKRAARETLKDFCRQDEEFAQAVAQGGSFMDCMKKAAEGVGSSISDLEAYTKAVQFYVCVPPTVRVAELGSRGTPVTATEGSSMVKAIVTPLPMPIMSPLNDTLEALPVRVALQELVDQPVPRLR